MVGEDFAVGLGGAYATLVDGLTVTGVVDTVFFGTAGEASFYKMWPAQIPPAERTVTLRNINADDVRTSALTLGGSGSFRNARCASALRTCLSWRGNSCSDLRVNMACG